MAQAEVVATEIAACTWVGVGGVTVLLFVDKEQEPPPSLTHGKPFGITFLREPCFSIYPVSQKSLIFTVVSAHQASPLADSPGLQGQCKFPKPEIAEGPVSGVEAESIHMAASEDFPVSKMTLRPGKLCSGLTAYAIIPLPSQVPGCPAGSRLPNSFHLFLSRKFSSKQLCAEGLW